MARKDRRFKLVEIEGFSERDLYSSEDLEEIAEYLGTKTGVDEFDVRLPGDRR